MTGAYVDMLETALTAYFDCRGKAYAELRAVLEHFKDDAGLCRSAHRLRGALRSSSMMSRGEEVDISRILQALERDIAAGTSRQYVDDEYCMSGGGYETCLTDEARQLSACARSLKMLQIAWDELQQAIAVDRELLRIRG